MKATYSPMWQNSEMI